MVYGIDDGASMIEHPVQLQDAYYVILHLNACSKKCLVVNGQLPISPKLWPFQESKRASITSKLSHVGVPHSHADGYIY